MSFKKLSTILAFLALTSQAFAVDTVLKTDKLKLGVPTNTAADKILEANKGSGSTNPKVKWNGTTSKWQFSNDGTNFKDFGSGSGGGGGINFLQDSNPDFEQGTSGWTASGGSFTIDTSTNLFHDLKTGAFDASASSQTLTSTTITLSSSVAPGLQGGAGYAACYIKTAATDYKIQVYDGTNVIATRDIPALTTFQEFGVGFPIPTSGTIALRIISGSNAAAIYLDDCVMGQFKFANVGQASRVGTAYYAATASCSWSFTSSSFSDPSATSACPPPTVTGNISNADDNLPQITLPNAPAGIYEVHVTTGRIDYPAGANFQFQLVDSTNTESDAGSRIHTRGDDASTKYVTTGTLQGSWRYTTAGTRVFKVRAKTDTATVTLGNDASQLSFVVDYFPLQSDAAFRVDNASARWSGYHDSTCLFSRTNSSLGDPTADSTCVFTERKNRNFGTVTSYLSGSDKLPGIVFTPPRVGMYDVCAYMTTLQSSGGATMSFELSDTNSNVIALQNKNSGTANEYTPMPLCGIYEATSLASTTIRVRTAASSGNVDIRAPGTGNPIEWTISLRDTPSTAPVFPGNLSSNTTGLERMESASLGGSSNCSLDLQSGTWITSASASTGICTYTVTGFSAAPRCLATATDGASSTNICKIRQSAVTSTSVEVDCTNSGGTNTNTRHNLFCMGPK